jgi:hypothetical protein
MQDGYRQQVPQPPPDQQQSQQQQQLLAHAPKPAPMYAPQSSYQDTSALYHSVHYSESQAVPHGLHYTTVPASMNVVDSTYAPQHAFPTPPLQQGPSHPESPPESNYSEQYGQQDLADLLGSLKVNEAGTGKELSFVLVIRLSDSIP